MLLNIFPTFCPLSNAKMAAFEGNLLPLPRSVLPMKREKRPPPKRAQAVPQGESFLRHVRQASAWRFQSSTSLRYSPVHTPSKEQATICVPPSSRFLAVVRTISPFFLLPLPQLVVGCIFFLVVSPTGCWVSLFFVLCARRQRGVFSNPSFGFRPFSKSP